MGDRDDHETRALSKLVPVAVSTPEAWALFDRSISSGYTPDVHPITVHLAHPGMIDAVKVVGPAPYRLDVHATDGTALGFATIDLSTLTNGWHAFASNAPARTGGIDLVFTPTSKTSGVIPELELWSSDADEQAVTNLFDAKLPDQYSVAGDEVDPVRLAAGECKEFAARLDRPSALFARAYLRFHATGAFRSFALEYSVNGTATSGASWLTGYSGDQSFVERIDPGTLNAGPNAIRLCVPASATNAVEVSDVRLIGESDRGDHLVASIRIGADARNGDAALDGDQNTSISVASNEELLLKLDRLVAPDALVWKGPLQPDAVHADCLDRSGHRTALHTAAFAAGATLDGAAVTCAALAIRFDEPSEISELQVVGSGTNERVDWSKLVITSATEHFGNVAWIGGFTVRPPNESGSINVEIANEHELTGVGRFGGLIHRNDRSDVPWTADVTALYPDGTRETQTVTLARNSGADLSAALGKLVNTTARDNEVRYSDAGKSIVTKALPAAATSIHLGTLVGVNVPPGAVPRPTNITVRHLPTSGLPPLDAGMINVTAPDGHGYEFLPHGQHFAKAVDAVVPFDPALIPSAQTMDDVRTYYYDTASKHWKPLTRTALDVKDHVVHNATDHFTVMVDAVLAIPTTPTPLSLDPTSLSGIPAATPATGIDLVEPPSASSTGDAHLSYPIRIPAGRGAYSPSVGLAYSSANANGWLGVGWDVPVSRIEIDTRWGVPTYADGEEPRYLLDGAQLVPTTDTDGPTCGSGPTGRRYHTRAEGAFSHILRCGADPATYWWEIYDRNGTKYVYGGTTSANPDNSSFLSTKPRPATCTGACPPGVYRWMLHTVTDTHSNTTTYTYFVDNVATTEPGRDVLPASILYTSHGAEAAQYSVSFILDGASRVDPIISGRGGFKQQTRRLLRSIRVSYGSSVIREYVLTYAKGMFDKSTLTTVQHFGEGGCTAPGTNAFALPTCTGALDQHTFTYVNDPTHMQSFGAPQKWAGATADGVGLYASNDVNTFGDLSLTSPIPGASDAATIGINGSWGNRTNIAGVYDFNGDGLPDQLSYNSLLGTPPVPSYNQGEIAGGGSGTFTVGTNQGGSTGLLALGFENHSTWGVDARVGPRSDGFGPSLSGGYSEATSRAKKTLADIDGDGYLDYVDAQATAGQEARLGGPCGANQCFTANPFGALAMINPGGDPLLGGYNKDIKARAIPADPVAQWTPPYTGVIDLSASAQLIQDSIADGVTVSLYQGDTLIGGGPGVGTMTTVANPWSFNKYPMQVHAGEPIYLVLSTGANDGSTSKSLSEKVTTYLDTNYVSAQWNALNTSQAFASDPDALTPTGAILAAFDLQQDFRVGQTRPLTMPVTGTVALKFALQKQTSAADIRWCLQRFTKNATSTDVPCLSSAADVLAGGIKPQADTTPAQALAVNLAVAAGDRFVLRAEGVRDATSGPFPEQYYSIDPATFVYSTQGYSAPNGVYYTAACQPGQGPGCTQSNDPSYVASIQPDESSFGVFAAAVSPPAPLGAVPMTHQTSFDEPYSVIPFPNPFGANAPIYIALRGTLRGTEVPVYCAGATCTYPTFEGHGGEWVSFEITGAPPNAQFPINPMTIQIQMASTIENVPVTFRSWTPPTHPQTPFFGEYQGWGFGFWNDRKTFTPNELLTAYSDPTDSELAGWCATQPTCESKCSILASPRECERADLATSALPPLPMFAGTPLADPEPTWIAEGGNAFINTTAMYAADIGGGGFGAGALPDGGLFETQYLRLSGTASHYIGADLSLRAVSLPGSLSGSVGESETTTTTDLVDVNGDGVLDVVSGNGTWAGHIATTPGLQLSGLAFNSPQAGFRRRTGYDYSVSTSGLASFPSFTSGGRYLAELVSLNAPDAISYDTSSGLSFGRTQETQDLIDINGDGLPDVVTRTGTTITVRYNFGSSLGAPETFGTVDATMNAAIDGFQSKETSTGLDTTSNALTHETTLSEHDTTTYDIIFAKFTNTTNTSSTRTTRMLVDINGDGLPDLVKKQNGQPITVQINRGAGFGASTSWTDPAWTYNSVNLLPSATQNFSSSFTSLLTGTSSMASIDTLAGSTRSTSSSNAAAVSIPLGPVNMGLSFSYQRSFENSELTFLDINGDGAPDHVLRIAGDPSLYVKMNNVRTRSNLLTTVHRPLGGTITLTYADSGNTPNMPHRRQVLSRVDVDDGVNMGTSYASPTLTTTFSYQAGNYSRLEKQFLGFSKVITTYAANGGSLEQTFDNTSVRTAGSLLQEVRKDTGGTMLSNHVLTYETLAVKDTAGALVQPHAACAAALPDLLKRETSNDACTTKFVVAYVDATTRYEGGVGKTRTVTDTAIDNQGDVTTSKDTGDDAITTDDNLTVVGYANYVSTTNWILGRPKSIGIYNPTQSITYRYRTGGYNATGTELTSINVSTGTGTATTTLGYDPYGNVNHVTTPPNSNTTPENQTYDIVYDPAVHTYPVSIANGFGETSTATYDVRYGVATLETDVSGNSLTRTFDTYGRLATVSGPYDVSSPGITMAYHPEASPPMATTVTNAAAPAGYTGTLPTAITTATFIDGLGRPIELRKTANVGGVVGTTTSGMVNRDALGRVIATYQPFFTAGASTVFVTPIATYATSMQYDAQSRTITTTLPDNSTTTTAFAVATYPNSSTPLFRETVTDPNSHPRETYTDLVGHTRAFVEHPTTSTSSTTTYDYDPAGQLVTIVDADNNAPTTLTYDWRGLRTKLVSPDTGTVIDTYDLMGNHATHQDARHAAMNPATQVTYQYTKDRLMTVVYPPGGKPNASYTYTKGRIATVSDETGTQTYTYGALGEKRDILRTIKRLDGTTATFDTHFTTDSLGRQLQVVYPDGTTISNTYDEGGALKAVAGAGSGWTKTYADQLQYDVFGNRTRMRYGNNVVSTWTYEPQRVRLSTVTTTLPSGPNVQQLVYTYDPASNPKTINNNLPALSASSGMRPGPYSLTLNYDNVDQLLSVTPASGSIDPTHTTTYSESFTYSPSHRINTKTRSHAINGAVQNATSFTSTYNYVAGKPPHLPATITSSSPVAGDVLTLTYDPSGNPIERDDNISGSHQTLTWDDDNRLNTITTASYTQTNRYDAFGLRAVRDGGTQHTLFANQYYDLEGTSGGTKYVYAGATRIAAVLGTFTGGANPAPPTASGTAYYLHSDHLDSTAVVTNEAGDAQESHDYFVDGELWIDHTSASPVNGYLFEDKPYDKLTGFYDYGQRFYDPRTSLWLGDDPAFTSSPGSAIGRPVVLSVSQFSGNSPESNIDQDGRDFRSIGTLAHKILTASRDEHARAAWRAAEDAHRRYERAKADIFWSASIPAVAIVLGSPEMFAPGVGGADEAVILESTMIADDAAVSAAIDSAVATDRALGVGGASVTEGGGASVAGNSLGTGGQAVTSVISATDESGAAGRGGSLFRSGGSNPGSLKLRPGEEGLSFRDSLSNPIGSKDAPVFRPGAPYIEVDASQLPAGSVFRDNVPPGHVTVSNATVDEIKAAIISKGKLPD